jgi:hypothetical protein
MSLKNSILLFTTVAVCAIAVSCRSSHQTVQSRPVWSIQAGLNKGGIVENTNMNDIADAAIDAFSGATRTGFNAGVSGTLPLKAIALETGLGFMQNHQSFSWADETKGFMGSHDLRVNQLMLPTTVNFMFFRKQQPDGMMQVKLGHLLQHNLVSANNLQGTIPEYSISKWSNGLVLGITLTPFRLRNGSRAGFFAEAYRGTQIYEDAYNLPEFEVPGSSFVKYGLIYRIK